eukprot:130649-Prymnesium_polylepis.1
MVPDDQARLQCWTAHSRSAGRKWAGVRWAVMAELRCLLCGRDVWNGHSCSTRRSRSGMQSTY